MNPIVLRTYFRNSSAAVPPAAPAVAADGAIRLGRYELLQPLGIGGMAEVFKARTQGPGGFERQVVIKRILPGHTEDPEFVRMFIDEAKILGMLHHPNVVQVYDFGEDEGRLFLALEYVDGPSVSRVLRALRAANRKMPPAVAAYLCREVCRALDYVHGLRGAEGELLNVIHRDVTPSNIVLTSTGGVKLLDFGVAKFKSAKQLTKAGTVKGKPAYLAPEQLQGKTIDGRVDLFALGIVLHEMLSLEHLFAGDSDLITVKKIMEMEIPPPSAKRSDVVPALDRIVMKALARDRDARYSSAAEMARELDDFVLASQLHMEEVVEFIREIESELNQRRPNRVALPVERDAVKMKGGGEVGKRAEATQKDFALVVRMWTMGRLLWGGPRPAVIMVAVLVAIGAALGLGLRINVTTKGEANAAQTSAMPAPPVRQAPVVLPLPPALPERRSAGARPPAGAAAQRGTIVRVLPSGRLVPGRPAAAATSSTP
jgi:serine/threonine-protein kinase